MSVFVLKIPSVFGNAEGTIVPRRGGRAPDDRGKDEKADDGVLHVKVC
jgi:hypothetical protein